MLKNIKLTFEKGSILTSEMLISMDSFPKEFSRLLYTNYSDGIISGLNFYYYENNLYLNEGILKYENKLFLMTLPENLSNKMSNLEEGKKYFICATKIDNDEKQNITNRFLEIHFLETKQDFCFASLIFRKNLPIKLDYTTIKDFSDNNYLKISYFNYSCLNESSFPPAIFSIFAKELSEKENIPEICFDFISRAFNNETISIHYIKYFIYQILNKKIEKEEILKHLQEILSAEFKTKNSDYIGSNNIIEKEKKKKKERLHWKN
jgi:hypothetical protein